jgi:uncharacterized protein (TIGR03382 family)
MKKLSVTSVLLGASLLAGGATAGPTISQFPLHNEFNSGALWPNDQPRNNQFRGAGMEHQAMVQLADGTVLVVGTGSYTDIVPTKGGLSSIDAKVMKPTDAGADPLGRGAQPGTDANNYRVQGLCFSVKPDATQGLVVNNSAYFTKNDGEYWKNANKMAIREIDGGKAALVVYGFNPKGENNTVLYGTVIGPDCTVMSAQARLFAGQNDNYGGAVLAPAGVAPTTPGNDTVIGTLIGNGNGTDNAHAYAIKVRATGQTGAGAYQITPSWIIDTDQQEERSRQKLAPSPFPNTVLISTTSGNGQPTNNNILSLINTADGVPANQRVIWRKTVSQRQGNIRYTTSDIVPMLDAAGKPTTKFIYQSVKVDITGRQGRSKGKTAIQLVPVEISMQEAKLGEVKETPFELQSDFSHPGLTAGTYGPEKRPVAFVMSGTVTDSAAATATQIIGMNAAGAVEPVRALFWGPSSASYTSLRYGQNPQTPQGLSAPPPVMIIKNPGAGVAGGFKPEVKEFALVASVHHNETIANCVTDNARGTKNGTCGGKNATSLVLIPTLADAGATQGGNGNNPNDSSPVDPTGGTGGDSDSSIGGCSTSGGSTGLATFALLGLVAIRRRRSSK